MIFIIGTMDIVESINKRVGPLKRDDFFKKSMVKLHERTILSENVRTKSTDVENMSIRGEDLVCEIKCLSLVFSLHVGAEPVTAINKELARNTIKAWRRNQLNVSHCELNMQKTS